MCDQLFQANQVDFDDSMKELEGIERGYKALLEALHRFETSLTQPESGLDGPSHGRLDSPLDDEKQKGTESHTG